MMMEILSKPDTFSKAILDEGVYNGPLEGWLYLLAFQCFLNETRTAGKQTAGSNGKRQSSLL